MGNKQIAELQRDIERLWEDIDFFKEHIYSIRFDNIDGEVEVHLKPDGTLETLASHFDENIQGTGFDNDYDRYYFTHNKIKYFELTERI